MLEYILKRIISILITLFLVASLTFFLMHAVPGGPFTTDRKLPANVEMALNEKYHLNDPILKQYGDYILRLLKFDLGPSFRYEGTSVNDLIKEGFPVSARVGSYSIFLIIILGIPLGIISALKQNKWQDRIVMFIATLGVTIPSFVLATVFLYIFSVRLGWLPAFGVKSYKGYILPTVALSGFSISFIARLTRSTFLEIMKQDYIVTARAKGIKERDIIFKHALKNALIPIVTVLGPLIASLLTGTFVIEKIFALPGMGRHFVLSISNRDYTTIMGITIFYAVFLTIMVLIVDMVYAFIDPRIKLNKRG